MMKATCITEVCTEHGEGPVWDAVRNVLVIVDMERGALVEVTQEGRTTRHELGGVAAALRPRVGGGYVLAVARGFQLLTADFAPGGDVVTAFADEGLRMNDGGCDPQGRFYCGSMAYDEKAGAGTLYRFDPDRSVHPVLADLTIPNGLQWTADGRTVLHVDTPTDRIDAHDFDPDMGTFSNRRPFVAIPDGAGHPDGMAIDEDDGVWIALWGGSAVHHYSADGRLADVIEVNAKDVTACAFGGDDRSTLYITTSRRDRGDADGPQAGAVFAVPTGVRGAALHPFAG
ncbi:MAG TPA: SMP-30/gluconolactonase/LRE family protein [Amnibacterium sp.]|jgi:sugar lactone lactonase YvrE|nr:SMP-30/gluconolactonase/LRE family protein [Amnibacterium sp.]